MKNRLIPCVLACLMIFLVGCNGNTAKEAAQEITKTETSFPAGNTETNSQEDTAKEPESTAVQEETPITAKESQSTAESQTVMTVQTKPAEEKTADTPATEKPKAEPPKQTTTQAEPEKQTEQPKEQTTAEQKPVEKPTEKPAEPKPTEPHKQTFDVSPYVSYAKEYADNLAPYEIVRSALDANRWGFNARLTDGEKAALNASWASLPDFCDNRNALAVVDTSGSMYCYDNALPAAVALSLGLYFGERNTGIFHNHFIEFSSRPQLIEIKGKTFAERLEYLCTFNEVADTNVEAVFDLILDAAVRNNVPQEELPETLYLISDMEFNACVRNASVSNFASAKRRFAEHGYRLPQIVFWNVASRNSNQPVTKNEQGVALVSGCTPRLFSMVASGDLSPYSVMMDIIESERYAKISA